MEGMAEEFLWSLMHFAVTVPRTVEAPKLSIEETNDVEGLINAHRAAVAQISELTWKLDDNEISQAEFDVASRIEEAAAAELVAAMQEVEPTDKDHISTYLNDAGKKATARTAERLSSMSPEPVKALRDYYRANPVKAAQ